jgi:hypothetical protein
MVRMRRFVPEELSGKKLSLILFRLYVPNCWRWSVEVTNEYGRSCRHTRIWIALDSAK